MRVKTLVLVSALLLGGVAANASPINMQPRPQHAVVQVLGKQLCFGAVPAPIACDVKIGLVQKEPPTLRAWLEQVGRSVARSVERLEARAAVVDGVR